MDWIHCNNCFGLPDAEKTFYLTSCGHIYCKDCEEQCARSKCKLCGNQCSTIVLSSSLKPDVQMYFIDPDELLKKKLKEVHQVSEFQKNHRARLLAHQRKQLRKFKAVKEDFRKLLKNLKDLDGERKKLAHENDTLKKYIMIQRNAGLSESSSKGHSKFPYDNTTPRSNLDSVLSKFIDKSHSGKSERMCVISPPKDGKLGVIYGTPSPTSALQKLNLNASRSIESLQKRAGMQFDTPYSSPASIHTSAFVTPETPASLSQNDLFKSPTDQDSKFLQCQRMSKKKLVVHPFSPND
ncbi:putative E3 SUMO-protein ligase RNF212 like protein [Argiope bruennichi]|uniref:Putative E3 SUMO-protein ligase RNF212 like protein n=1 Tax=Argiope bruennichi TaxID=94029 RepID=A0A8T0F6V0_ARGBR|nr:putative E3 SUMO-protein ligase RNF212 like protein [Argiope bruennichi]